MALTYFIGIQRASYIDDKAWLPIPFTSATFQPSEVLKLAFILSFALHLERVRDSLKDRRTLFWLCLHAAGLTLMVVAQGDHGTAMVFLAVFAGMIFAAASASPTRRRGAAGRRRLAARVVLCAR